MIVSMFDEPAFRLSQTIIHEKRLHTKEHQRVGASATKRRRHGIHCDSRSPRKAWM